MAFKSGKSFKLPRLMPEYDQFTVPAGLQEDALEALKVARDTGMVKKGTNETTKALRRGNAELVLIASDVQPEEIILHLPELAEEKGIPYLFLDTQDEMGHAAGLEIGIAAAAIVDPGKGDKLVQSIVQELVSVLDLESNIEEDISNSYDVEVEISNDSLEGQIERAAEEMDMTRSEREKFEDYLYRIVDSREDEYEVQLSDKARNQLANMLAAVWRQERPQLQAIMEEME